MQPETDAAKVAAFADHGWHRSQKADGALSLGETCAYCNFGRKSPRPSGVSRDDSTEARWYRCVEDLAQTRLGALCISAPKLWRTYAALQDTFSIEVCSSLAFLSVVKREERDREGLAIRKACFGHFAFLNQVRSNFALIKLQQKLLMREPTDSQGRRQLLHEPTFARVGRSSNTNSSF